MLTFLPSHSDESLHRILPSLIAPALERRFPNSKTMFSPRKGGSVSDAGIVKIFSRDFVEALARNVAGLLPWDKVPKALVDDRVKVSEHNLSHMTFLNFAKFFGMDPAAAKEAQPHSRGQLFSQLVRTAYADLTELIRVDTL